MKVKIIRNTVAGGKPVFAGDTVEVSDRDGDLLLKLNKAEIPKERQRVKKGASK